MLDFNSLITVPRRGLRGPMRTSEREPEVSVLYSN